MVCVSPESLGGVSPVGNSSRESPPLFLIRRAAPCAPVAAAPGLTHRRAKHSARAWSEHSPRPRTPDSGGCTPGLWVEF